MDDEDATVNLRTGKKRPAIDEHHMFKLCSAILIPIMIALLTLTLSIVQLYIAKEERKQDFLISEANREKDRFIAGETREQDLLIANKLRWDTILATYIREISDILSQSNFSSKKMNPLIATVVRSKTLTACRQLDAECKSWLIQFLYESGGITVGQNPIDMTNANLDGIDLSTSLFNSIQQASLRAISLSGASLINASFNERYLNGANFSGCTMLGASFKRTQLDDAIIQKASLRNADFTRASTKRVSFVWSDLRRSNINDYQLHHAHSFYLTVLPNGTFGRHTNLIKNGNAEDNLSCSCNHLTPIFNHHWKIIPSQLSNNVGFMKINNSLIQSQIDHGWTEKLGHSFIEEDMKTNADISWNVGQCSFVTTTLPLSLIQHFIIPKYYQHAKRSPHSWHITIFCGILTNVDIDINLTLVEKNDYDQILQTYQFELYPKSTFLYADRPYNKHATQASFEIKFLPGTENHTITSNNHVPIVFCDNIHISLELTSAVSVINFGF